MVGLAVVVGWFLAGAVDAVAQPAQTAQATPITPLAPRDRRLEAPEFPSPVRPRLQLPPPPSPGLDLPAIPSLPTIIVRRFTFEGSMVFSEDELQAVAAPYADRPVASEDLEELRQRLIPTAEIIDRRMPILSTRLT